MQVSAPAEPDRPREYSIASIPRDGGVHLLVRQHAHPDGSLGLASGWLTAQAKVGDVVQLRLRQHRRFRLEDNANLLDSSLAAADLVICQTGCISHSAYWRVKDYCKRTGKRCVFIDNPSISSLARGLQEVSGEMDTAPLAALQP